MAKYVPSHSSYVRLKASRMEKVVLASFLILGFAAGACRSTKVDSGSELRSQRVNLPGVLETKESWDILSPEVRLDILDSEYRSYSSLKLTEAKDPGLATNPQEKALIDKMQAYIRSTTDLRIEDKSHAQIGPMQATARILLLHGETVLGGELRFFQKGCVMPDQTAPHFGTEAQAKKAGCEISEQSAWSALGQFNYDGVPFAVSDFIEWQGN